ncbi:TerB family tellurite resistance protein [Paracoccus sp. SSK6]|uniref:tellurite resistance TerB family protein n=1 Tax=Paracoccus sp. SSK6 TaxID=3143131 RepID=UPI00321AB43A
MIPSADITGDTRDITALWRRMTGNKTERATAHLRGGSLTAVTVNTRPRLVMCRAGACALITGEAVAAIEAGTTHSPRPISSAPGGTGQSTTGHHRMFGKLFGKKAEAAVQKFSGRTDFLEATCAAAALIAAADGEIEDAEVTATVKAVKANKSLAAGFDGPTIERTINAMLDRAGGGRVGRAGLRKEIMEIAKDPEMAEGVILTALDVAEADGEIEPEEQKILDSLAKELGIDLARLAA